MLMSGTETTERSKCRLGGQTTQRTRKPGDTTTSNNESSTSSPPVEAEAHNDFAQSPGSLLSLVRERLDQDPRFHGRSSLLQIELLDGVVIVSGRFPSFYLKQLLQEAIRRIPGVTGVDNHVEVA